MSFPTQEMNEHPHTDYPHVRSSGVCPLCRKHKEVGLVTCWDCYRAHGLRFGNPEAEGRIVRADAELVKDGKGVTA